MEPRIQYAKTSDGVSIAFWTLGEGPPLVMTPAWLATSTLAARRLPEVKGWQDRLAEGRMLLRYDPRGSGLSDREVADLSLDARLLDLEAVVDCLALERFAMLAYGNGGPQAIAYAARHPQRVTHLLLWCTYARPSDGLDLTRLNALLGLADIDWQLFTETFASDFLGWSAGEEARRFAAYLRENATPEMLKAGLDTLVRADVTDLLPHIQSPTLVMHRHGISRPDLSVARNLASRIPHARLLVLEGESVLPFLGDVDAVLKAVDEFLGGNEKTPVLPEPPAAGGFRTVLFTDIVGHTEMMSRLGDARGRDVLREHERIVREALKAHDGSEVKTMGDGFMAAFTSATRALECATAIQRAFAEWNAGVGAQGLAPLHIRIGLNAGEPIAEDEDLFGTAVIRAARIAAMAQGGEILVANVVRELSEGKGFLFADRGEHVLRGFEDPVRVFEISWRDEN